MVLNNEEYLIGVDPISGDQLWKIKDNGVDEIRLINNALVAGKAAISDESLIINIYNRDNGNLIGNENIDISKSLNNWILSSSACKNVACLLCNNFSISSLKYSDKYLLFLMHDGIIKVIVCYVLSRNVHNVTIFCAMYSSHLWKSLILSLDIKKD